MNHTTMGDHPLPPPHLAPSTCTHMATHETVLYIPRAQDWSKGVGLTLESDRSHVLFRVLEHRNRGSQLEPNYRTILTDASTNDVLCLVKYNRKTFRPHYCIYVATSCFQRRKSGDSSSSGDRDQVPPNMVLYGVLYNDGEFHMMSCPADQSAVDDKPWRSFQYRSVRGGKRWCGCAGSSRRVIEVCDTENTAAACLWTRNQLDETMTAPAGSNLVVAAALAYALDRRYKPLGSTVERQDRVTNARRQAEILGLKGTTNAKPKEVKATTITTTTAARRRPNADHHDNTHNDASEAWDILEQSESQCGADPMVITLAERPRPKAVAAGVPTLPIHTAPHAAPASRKPRRKRQLSAPILEMDGDVSNGSSSK